MEWSDDVLRIGRELSELDRKVIDFVEVLENKDVRYVLVSGYVAILAGRSRGTEDVDLIIEKLGKEDIDALSRALKEEGYWCINTGMDGIQDMLEDDLSVRFAEEGKAIPNFEVAFPQNSYDERALEERLRIELNRENLYVSPLELQIVYKLYLGSEKDFEDALHLYRLFRDGLDDERLESLARELDVRGELDELRRT